MRIVGVDPSFTGFAISDGTRHERKHTDAVIGLPEEEGLLIRCFDIAEFVTEFLEPFGDETVEVWIEAPQESVPEHGGTHIYQVGWLMREMYGLAQHRTHEGKITTVSLVVNGTVLKEVLGKGNVAKSAWSKEALKQHGIDIPDDRNLDKLVAWMLYRYGMGVRNGEWERCKREHVKRGGAKRKK